MNRRWAAALIVLSLFLWWHFGRRVEEPRPLPEPAPSPRPEPRLPRRPCPGPNPCPRDERGAVEAVEVKEGFKADGPEMGGEQITCDLPTSLHLKNTGGIDGAGLCVFASLTHAARWADEPIFSKIFDWMKKNKGGGWPEKVDQMARRLAAELNAPVPDYLQHTGGDLEFLRRALKSYRYVCVTYDGRDGVFYKGRIAHMVNLVHLSDKYAVIHDNNYPGRWLWMSPGEFKARWGDGWAVVLLEPGPPPIPVNFSRPQDSFESSGSAGFVFDRRFVTPAGLPVVPPTVKVQATPKAPPESLRRRIEMRDNYGLDRSRIPAEESYRRHGRPLTRTEAIEAVEGGWDCDWQKYRLTVVGEEEICRRVKEDLATAPALKDWREKLILKTYPENHWAITGVNLQKGLTLQEPPRSDGTARVLWRFRTYQGPEALSIALRRADPTYQPNRDPDPLSAPSLPDWASRIKPEWVFLAVLIAILVLSGRSSRES